MRGPVAKAAIPSVLSSASYHGPSALLLTSVDFGLGHGDDGAEPIHLRFEYELAIVRRS